MSGQKYVRVYHINYRMNTMDDSIVTLERQVDKHLSEHQELKIKQVEYMWGNQYGARVAVVYEDRTPTKGKDK